ncbi:unnamed protein product [Ectocarpus sp. CCAP 1310/34]|nr:unnamed protein product [Ectocarpus sp. CCAP 1310/34]
MAAKSCIAGVARLFNKTVFSVLAKVYRFRI